ncbi:hypothetical protein AVEN_249727-1 [Araneus ventricosus]|uniref:Uncharacterized protein n=1 Tax=Araneus ventricosus TaxID=182803 RepID=A0A4Y2C7N7_ARAVE|nr:hypothetical protein AVEN_249727-1 [Araneus ventricosus]
MSLFNENENLIKQPPEATSSSDSDPDFFPSQRPQTYGLRPSRDSITGPKSVALQVYRRRELLGPVIKSSSALRVFLFIWWSFTPPHHLLLLPSIKAHGNGLRSARIIGPPTTLISEAIAEPPLPSEETIRLRPAFVVVKGKFLDRPGPPLSV